MFCPLLFSRKRSPREEFLPRILRRGEERKMKISALRLRAEFVFSRRVARLLTLATSCIIDHFTKKILR